MRLLGLAFLLGTLGLVLANRPYETRPSAATIWFRWKGGDGDWENEDNWTPRGYPRAGIHNAIIDAPGTYTVRHTRFVLAGFVYVNGTGDPTLLLDSAIGFRLNDPQSIPPPQFFLEGEILGKPIEVTLFNFDLLDFTGPIEVDVTNLATGVTFKQDLEIETEGTYKASVPTTCLVEDGNVPEGTVNAVPFDTIEFSLFQNGTKWYQHTTLLYVDEYQKRFGFDELTARLFQIAVDKNIVRLDSLHDNLVYIKNELPAWKDNHCNPDERYEHPLHSQIPSFAKASDVFLRGERDVPPGEKRPCTEVCTFCSQMEKQMGSAIGPVHIRWTGLGDDNSWNNPRNWWPARIPNFASASVHIQSREHPEWIYLESDVEILDVTMVGQVTVQNGPFTIFTRSTAGENEEPPIRAWWFLSSDDAPNGADDAQSPSFHNKANWVGGKVPTSEIDAMVAGFGNMYVTTPVTVKSIDNSYGANAGYVEPAPDARSSSETNIINEDLITVA